MTDEMKPSKPQAEIDAMRAKMDELAERAKTDTAFVDDLKKDTVGTLVAAGVDEDAAREASTKWQDAGAEVEGHWRSCDNWTTWIWCTYFTY